MALDAIERVVSMRNALKGGKNLPVRAYGDNAFVLVDEARPFMFTKWDDRNGVVYVFRLLSLYDSTHPNNATEQSISVAAVLYEFIQVMEVSPMPLDNFDDVIGSMQGEGITFNPDFVNQMKAAFKGALDPERVTFDNIDKNRILGVDVKETQDAYYRGIFAENFKETREKAEYNAYVDKQNNG